MNPALHIQATPRRHITSWPIGLLVASLILLAGGNLAGNGVDDPTPFWAALPGFEQGSLLRVLLVWLAGLPGEMLDPAVALILLHVALAALLGSLLYRSLCTSNWPPLMAAALLLVVATHGLVLISFTFSRPEILLVLVLGALIPARRRLEAVGDVQSVINYGLALPLLLLAGPPLAALLPILVLAVATTSGSNQADREPGAFMAMFVVSVMPLLIVVAGVTAMALRNDLGVGFLFAPYVAAFTLQPGGIMPLAPALLSLALVALAVPLHLAIPDRRRQIRTSVLTIALPLYVLVGNAVFSRGLAPWTPALALLATTLGWLASTRVRPWMRWLVLILTTLSSLISWLLSPRWADPDWLAGLLPLHVFGWTL